MSKKNRKTSTTKKAPAAPVTVAEIEKKSKFEYVVVNIICLFAFLAFGYIAIMGFFQTSVIDPTAYSAEKILYQTDNLALNLLFTAIFVGILFTMRRFYDFFAKINITALEIILVVYVVLLGFIWIFSVTSIPAADSANVYETARQAAKNQYTSLHDFTNFYNKDFYGGYSYYKEKEREEEAKKAQQAPPAAEAKKEREPKRAQERPAREAKRRLSFGEQKEYAEIEGVIASKEGELKVVRLEMQQNASDYTRLAELGREETRLAAELDHLMERWAYLEEIAEQQDS